MANRTEQGKFVQGLYNMNQFMGAVQSSFTLVYANYFSERMSTVGIGNNMIYYVTMSHILFNHFTKQSWEMEVEFSTVG